jgi:hypothetical protein
MSLLRSSNLLKTPLTTNISPLRGSNNHIGIPTYKHIVATRLKILCRVSGYKHADATRPGNFEYPFSESRRDDMFVAIIDYLVALSPVGTTCL